MSSQVPCLSSSTPPLWSCWPYPHQEERLPKHSLRPSTSGVHIVRAGSYMVDFPLLPPQGCLMSGGGGGRGLTLDECPGPPLHLTSCEQTGSSPNNCIFLADHPPLTLPSFHQESYSAVLYDEVLQTLRLPLDSLPPLSNLHVLHGGNQPACLLSLVHAYWHHTNLGPLLHLPQSVCGWGRVERRM